MSRPTLIKKLFVQICFRGSDNPLALTTKRCLLHLLDSMNMILLKGSSSLRPDKPNEQGSIGQSSYWAQHWGVNIYIEAAASLY